MESTLIYLFQASVCLSVFYIVYWILFRRNTFFKINRIYLLTSILVSLIIPVFNFTSFFIYENYGFSYMLEPINIYARKISTANKSYSFINPISLIYIAEFIFFALIFINKLFKINKIIKKFRLEEKF